MKIYFVRNKHTGHYIPRPEGRNGRGGSHLEPIEDKSKARIFLSERSAKIFISTWARGKFVAYRGSYQSYAGDYDYEEDISLIPQPHRNVEDMEIVMREITL